MGGQLWGQWEDVVFEPTRPDPGRQGGRLRNARNSKKNYFTDPLPKVNQPAPLHIASGKKRLIIADENESRKGVPVAVNGRTVKSTSSGDSVVSLRP